MRVATGYSAVGNFVQLYRTQGGIFTTPGDAYTTPVEMWVKAFGTWLSREQISIYFLLQDPRILPSIR